MPIMIIYYMLLICLIVFLTIAWIVVKMTGKIFGFVGYGTGLLLI